MNVSPVASSPLDLSPLDSSATVDRPSLTLDQLHRHLASPARSARPLMEQLLAAVTALHGGSLEALESPVPAAHPQATANSAERVPGAPAARAASSTVPAASAAPPAAASKPSAGERFLRWAFGDKAIPPTASQPRSASRAGATGRARISPRDAAPPSVPQQVAPLLAKVPGARLHVGMPAERFQMPGLEGPLNRGLNALPADQVKTYPLQTPTSAGSQPQAQRVLRHHQQIAAMPQQLGVDGLKPDQCALLIPPNAEPLVVGRQADGQLFAIDRPAAFGRAMGPCQVRTGHAATDAIQRALLMPGGNSWAVLVMPERQAGSGTQAPQ